MPLLYRMTASVNFPSSASLSPSVEQRQAAGDRAVIISTTAYPARTTSRARATIRPDENSRISLSRFVRKSWHGSHVPKPSSLRTSAAVFVFVDVV